MIYVLNYSKYNFELSKLQDSTLASPSKPERLSNSNNTISHTYIDTIRTDDRGREGLKFIREATRALKR